MYVLSLFGQTANVALSPCFLALSECIYNWQEADITRAKKILEIRDLSKSNEKEGCKMEL